ncbi:MFS general substrate transporter [Venturia nashicola]|uniref:MFS general substrate transporter n=1 Tax=Venturia nashicola TaxID=86259 RepID=A0A4Z1NRG3_9PEZI|nr:MFS general substrate transporter [Venturia nashicola]
MLRWKLFGEADKRDGDLEDEQCSGSDDPEAGGESIKTRPAKWSLGILNDKETDEVPGSILLLSKVHNRNEPLGLRHEPARTSTSFFPSQSRSSSRSRSRTPIRPAKKTTPDGKTILDPQPDESPNDPLQWPLWRRNAALLSLGLYCLLGGGMTPILAAAFNDVATTYHVTVPQVALTTGLFMMGLGIGCVIMSPTAILFGKRPVYLGSAILFLLTNVWCALSPTYSSLVVARIVQGIAVSPVECLPSATVAEIFYLHERAYRLGIYTLLLLGGKNLVPLVSAAIVGSLSWRWVFWIVTFIVAFFGSLLFFFVPETFWDRTPRPHHITRHVPTMLKSRSMQSMQHHDGAKDGERERALIQSTEKKPHSAASGAIPAPLEINKASGSNVTPTLSSWQSPTEWAPIEGTTASTKVSTPDLHNLNSPWYNEKAEGSSGIGYFSSQRTPNDSSSSPPSPDPTPAPNPTLVIPSPPSMSPDSPAPPAQPVTPGRSALKPNGLPYPVSLLPGNGKHVTLPESLKRESDSSTSPVFDEVSTENPSPALPNTDTHIHHSSEHHGPKEPLTTNYTEYYRAAPAKTYWQTLRPFSGRLCHDNWLRVAFRPFVLYAYPAILWSSVVYSLSVGWLIVLSESMSLVYKNSESYNFTSLQTGLVYISPFIGGILGTAVAGKVSDLIVRFMSRRNGGIYEPEFRLVMAIPIAICTAIGLMGFGWSAQERDNWIVPTVFFGIISFGCSLGSTTAITFAVDSYRVYAGEALVTLNFSKNIFHGLVFSLFFPKWLESDGSKNVFLALGGIHVACLLSTIPMYIFGKRARMMTVRKNMMENF